MSFIFGWVIKFVAPYLSKGLPYILGIVVLGAAGGLLYLRIVEDNARIATLSGQVAGASSAIAAEKATNAEDQAAIKRLKLQAAAWEHAEGVVAADYAQVQANASSIDMSIAAQAQPISALSNCSAQSKPQTDGLIAPVLDDTLRDLKADTAP